MNGDECCEGSGGGGSCPFALGRNKVRSSRQSSALPSLTYNNYLQLDAILGACRPISFEAPTKDKPAVHDEHLFIITHQAFELWLKQILFEIDSIRDIFSSSYVNERQSLIVVTRLQRIVAIFKVCVSHFEILETMSPLDFLEFRTVLKQASGFQSVQFRLLENKLGVLPENRVHYAKHDYKEILQSEDHFQKVAESELSDSLFDLIEKWLERTPGAFDETFWTLFEKGANRWLFDTFVVQIDEEQDSEKRRELEAEMVKQRAVIDRLFNKEAFSALRLKGEIRLSHAAFLGALFITLWRTEPRFSQPYQILSLLMDVDSLMTKFRYAHVTMVHRMIGARTGTGGSSGYQYLRSTIGDRYKVFADIFNLSAYIIPRAYLPPLPVTTRRRLSSWHILASSPIDIIKADEEQQENAPIA